MSTFDEAIEAMDRMAQIMRRAELADLYEEALHEIAAVRPHLPYGHVAAFREMHDLANRALHEAKAGE